MRLGTSVVENIGVDYRPLVVKEMEYSVCQTDTKINGFYKGKVKQQKEEIKDIGMNGAFKSKSQLSI